MYSLPFLSPVSPLTPKPTPTTTFDLFTHSYSPPVASQVRVTLVPRAKGPTTSFTSLLPAS